jgi:hypothetical protein
MYYEVESDSQSYTFRTIVFSLYFIVYVLISIGIHVYFVYLLITAQWGVAIIFPFFGAFIHPAYALISSFFIWIIESFMPENEIITSRVIYFTLLFSSIRLIEMTLIEVAYIILFIIGIIYEIITHTFVQNVITLISIIFGGSLFFAIWNCCILMVCFDFYFPAIIVKH